MSHEPSPDNGAICACGCGSPAKGGQPLADHPHTDPGDGRKECLTCGKWVHLVTHSCKRVPLTEPAMARFRAAREANHPPRYRPAGGDS